MRCHISPYLHAFSILWQNTPVSRSRTPISGEKHSAFRLAP